MAYIHCAKCDWEQGDFWSWKYNPITNIWDNIKWLWIPKIIYLDDWIITDITAYTGIKVHLFEKPIKKNIPAKTQDGKNIKVARFDFCRKGVFSWQWLIVEIVKDFKNAKKMKWWTYKKLKHDRKSCCPSCGLNGAGWWIMD